MASTSDQSSGEASFSNSDDHSRDHDVFLSFRGIDTRKSFTSHLHNELTRSGIKTFMDDQQLPTGEDISPKLLEAIQRSRASIIVFSKNYASSSWCLEELVEILECKRIKGQLVFPIYYDVEPSVMRFLTGKYAEAFQKHSTRVSELKVHKWRAALQQVADLKGHVLANEDNGNEVRFIQKIVGLVQAEVIARCTSVAKSLIEASGDSNRKCINALLNIGSSDVRMIGIYGMGGIGKSTVSKAVYSEHVNKFQSSAVVENIKDISKQADGLLQLQVRLLCQLEKKDVKLYSTDEGIERIRRICDSTKVLILLDDFDNLDQINKLGIHKRWFSIGSRVILVTRNANLLEEAQVQQQHTYEMKLMNEDESLKLFRKHAIEEEEEEAPSKDQELLSSDIAKACAGLPLSLEVIGRHLRGRNLTFWKNALEELQSNPPDDVHKSLKISYDALNKDRKNVFLDAACFFIGWKKEYLIQFWGGCGFPKNSIDDLIDKCLIKIDENKCLWMHDHLRDMGRAIVLEASKGSLEKQSRLWVPEQVHDLLRNQIKKKAVVEGILLNVSMLRSITLDAKSFEIMHKLRLLEINEVGVNISGSFENVFEELRWLTWKSCPLDNVPLAFHPTNLIGLDLQHSEIKKLWEGVKDLPNLKIIDLSRSEWLEETPDFTGTPTLQRLILHGCIRLSRIHSSICQLTSLVELQLESCESLEEIPEQLGNIESLQILNLCKTSINNLPEQLGSMRSLQTLNLSGTCIAELPDSIGQLHRLVSLQSGSCRKLKSIPTSICSLRSLQELDLGGCSGLQQLPEQLGNMEGLLHLKLWGCKNIRHVPESICNLTALRTLGLSGCSQLESLPQELGNLECLLELDLSWCQNLPYLPASICNLLSLQDLNVFLCSKLNELPKGLGNLKKLMKLNVGGTLLEELPNSIRHLTSLVDLRFGFCRNLKTFPDTICDLSSLQVLNMDGCKNFKTLPDNICDLSYLQSLVIDDCYGLQQLPDRLGDMVSLRDLQALDTGCKQLPYSINNLKELETLSFSQSDAQSNDLLERFVIPSNSSLKRLTLKNCGLHDEDITDVIGMGLSSLQSLDLSGNNLCNPSQNLQPLSNLTILYLRCCENLVSLSELPPNLTELDLSRCKNLVSLSELPPNLKRIIARGCTSLKVMPNLSNLQFLRKLDLLGCNSLVELQGLENLKQLNCLQLGGCNNMARNANINERFFQRYFEDVYDVTLPKWEFPNWIKYKSKESTITFQLPPSLPYNFQGIILWVDVDSDTGAYFYADIKNNTSGKEWTHNDYNLKGSGTWVRCIKESDFRGGDGITISIRESDGMKQNHRSSAFRSGDSITISIRENDGMKVERCGVHWWTGNHNLEMPRESDDSNLEGKGKKSKLKMLLIFSLVGGLIVSALTKTKTKTTRPRK